MYRVQGGAAEEHFRLRHEHNIQRHKIANQKIYANNHTVSSCRGQIQYRGVIRTVQQ